jgi:hypothetical protein
VVSYVIKPTGLAESGHAHEISETRGLLTFFDGKVVFNEESFEASSQR